LAAGAHRAPARRIARTHALEHIAPLKSAVIEATNRQRRAADLALLMAGGMGLAEQRPPGDGGGEGAAGDAQAEGAAAPPSKRLRFTRVGTRSAAELEVRRWRTTGGAQTRLRARLAGRPGALRKGPVGVYSDCPEPR
jgi:hypothetical protein